MAVVWSEEQPRERGGSGKYKDGSEWSRTFYVRTDALDTSIVDITNAPGIAFQDPHPDDSSTYMDAFDVKVADGTGLLYAVSFKYKKFQPDEIEPPEDQPGSMEFKPPVWGGTSSVTTGPVPPDVNNELKDLDGLNICNSAGDPLEGLEQEFAEERLTLTQYYASHNDWMELARTHTNATNDGNWNGGAERTWKCQGCSKRLNIENKDGTTTVYWEITWEFAYRADTWDLRPWDIGFAQLVDDEGTPTGSGTKRAQIKGRDGKGVRQPVALNNGIAKAAGEPPDPLRFRVYPKQNFGLAFGEVFTPGA